MAPARKSSRSRPAHSAVRPRSKRSATRRSTAAPSPRARRASPAASPGSTSSGSSAGRLRADRIATKRIYEPAGAADGTRVLVMRYWPRGIRRDRVDVWLRELAPIVPLLRSYLDGKITWAQYTPRYLAGLGRPEAVAALAQLHELAARGPVTLLCGCPDPQQCHRTLLQNHLRSMAEGA